MTPRAEAGLRIEQLDATDPAAMAAWHEAFLASHRHERPFATPLMLEEMQARFVAGLEAQRYLAFSGLVGDEVATVGMCYLTMRDNLGQAYVEVQTRPDLRGRGFGSRVLDHLEQVARDHGRGPSPTTRRTPSGSSSVASPTTSSNPSVPCSARCSPRRRPARSSGRRRCSTSRASGPTRRSSRSRAARSSPQWPSTGPGRWPPTASWCCRGTTPAASTSGGPWHARATRGHRLGLATKARNLLWAQRELGEATLVTFNAESNRHMVAVNEIPGFRPVERVGEFQKRL
ncbi:MAG TPA: GNAT family N-acetyltransferase [Nocardioidaceae bacterium]|nr:GNAT family N-acetyltransferase [Nocardioidaceae bacterium]